MQPLYAVDLARTFLDVLWGYPVPDDAALSRAIDRLLAASHDVPPCNGSNLDCEPPEGNHQEICAALTTRFPDYGWYPVALSPESSGDAIGMGDSIDDLADLTHDLREVVWRGDHFGSDDANWCFRLLYFHWSRHARELGLYLQGRQFG